MFIYSQKFFQIKNVPNIPKKMGTFSENIMSRHNNVINRMVDSLNLAIISVDLKRVKQSSLQLY